MLTLLSPAKTLDFEFCAEGLPTTEPRFEDDIEVLLERCQKLTVADLRKLMKISLPLDLMQPYRLEMGAALPNPRGKNLYEFWGSRLVDSLNAEHKKRPVKAVLNLASNEYFKAVPTKQLDPPLVTALFQELREGKLKTIAFSAKRARGLMARYIVKNRVDAPEGLKDFYEEGYSFRPDLSEDDRLLFVRDQHWKD